MRTSLCLLIIEAILLLSIICCPTAYDFGHSPSSCIFYVSYNDSTCSDFSFNSCTWRVCVRRGSDSCLQYQTRESNDWSGCTQRCCDQSVAYSRNSYAIRECQDYLDSIFIRDLLLILLIPIGVVGLVALCFCICLCQKCAPFKECLRNCFCIKPCACMAFLCCCEQKERLNNRVMSESNNPERSKLSKIEWRKGNEVSKHLEQTCSVCLNNLPSLELQCGHAFHRKCIIACMKKKKECILCRSTRYNRAKAYCEQCFQSYLDLSFLDNVEELEKEPQICRRCRQLGYRQIIIPDNMNL